MVQTQNWALCSCCFFPWCQGVVLCFLFGCTQGSLMLCVALFLALQCALGASCRRRLLGALFACSCFCIVGWLSVLCAFWGFLLLCYKETQ